VEPGCNDIRLYDASCLASNVVWYQLIPKNIILLRVTLIDNKTNYSVTFRTL